LGKQQNKKKTHTHTHKTKQNWWEPIRLHFQHTQKQERNQPTPNNLQENLLKTQNQISQLGKAASVFETSRQCVVGLAWRAAPAVT
jgi:hypothetical protein